MIVSSVTTQKIAVPVSNSVYTPAKQLSDLLLVSEDVRVKQSLLNEPEIAIAAPKLAEAKQRDLAGNPHKGRDTHVEAASRNVAGGTPIGFTSRRFDDEQGECPVWRNSSRCVARYFWQSLQVRDLRHLETEEQMFKAIAEQIKLATNNGELRAVSSNDRV